jgi:hypothetical protein
MKNENGKVSVLDLKDKLILTILGSYEKQAVTELISLRNCLQERGYKKCQLVCDYPFPHKKRKETSDQYFHRKSIFLARKFGCLHFCISRWRKE